MNLPHNRDHSAEGYPRPETAREPSSNTDTHPFYAQDMDEGLQKWGYDRKNYMPVAEANRLGTIIQAARADIEGRPEVKAKIQQLKEEAVANRKLAYPINSSIEGKALEIYLQELSPTDEAREAIDKLVESNLRFAAYIARASMNILPTQKSNQEINDEDEEPVVKRAAQRRIGAFSDITTLASPRAVLADRIQAANLGLITAAWKYDPTLVNKRGKDSSFLACAIWHIHSEIHDHVIMNEGPLISPTVSNIDALKNRQANWDGLSSRQQEETKWALEQLKALRDPVDIDEVWETLADTDDSELLDARLLNQALDEIFETLDERTATVIRERWGLEDGNPKTLDQIGKIIGVTRERVRQIESKAMSKLRHPQRSSLLLPFITEGEEDKYSAEARRNSRYDPVEPMRATSTKGRESWQAYPGERWEDTFLIQEQREKRAAEYDRKLAATLTMLITQASPVTFRDPIHPDARMIYPTALAEHISNVIGANLRGKHIAQVWNTGLEQIIAQSKNRLMTGHFSLDRMSQLFSHLFAEYIKNDEEVSIRIPESLDGTLNHVGAWLTGGHLTVYGNVGDYAGRSMAGAGRLTIAGNTGSYVGMDAHGYAAIAVVGNATDYTGCALRGNASVAIDGSVGNYCGYGMHAQEAAIHIRGDAGSDVGYRARSGEIQVRGTADSINLPRNSQANIVVGRVNPHRVYIDRHEVDDNDI